MATEDNSVPVKNVEEFSSEPPFEVKITEPPITKEQGDKIIRLLKQIRAEIKLLPG